MGVRRLLMTFIIVVAVCSVSVAQMVEKHYQYFDENPALFLDENLQKRVLSTCDSLLESYEYNKVILYVDHINNQLSQQFLITPPLFQAKIQLRTAKAFARQNNINNSYLALKIAEVNLLRSSTIDSTLNKEVYGWLSSVCRYLGYYEEALEYSHLLLPLIDEKESALEKADAYNLLGLVHSRLFNKKLAMEYFTKCYNLRERVAPQWLPYVMNNIGNLYEKTKEYDSALYWYNKAYNFSHPRLHEDNIIHAALLENISSIYSGQNRNMEALESINQSLRIRLKYQKATHAHVLGSALRKVDILLDLGDMKKVQIVLDFIEASIAFGKDPILENFFYKQKANFKFLHGEFDSAIYLMDEAIASLDPNIDRGNVTSFLQSYKPTYPDYPLIYTLEEKGNMYFKNFNLNSDPADLQLATLYNEKAIEFMHSNFYRQPNIISDPDVYFLSKRLLGNQLNLLDQLKKIDSTAISSRILTSIFESDRMHSVKKNLIYNQLLASDLSTEYLLKERERLNNLLMKEESKNANSQKQDSLFTQLNDLEIKLKAAMGSYYNLKIKESYTISNNYLQDLPSNSALVQYFFADSILHCLYATTESFNWYKIEWKQQDNESLKLALNMLQDPTNRQYGYLEELGIKLLPFLKDGSEKKLVIIPSGILHHLPFETLIVDDVFMVKNYTISYLEALSWPENLTRNYSNKFRGFAPFESSNPENLVSKTTAVLRNSSALKELNGSYNEIQNASAYFDSEIFESTAATETELKASTENYKAVHLATHGLMEDSNPLMNSIVLAADTINDGFLHTYELFHLKLPAELAILSACNTGNGNYQQGEGMLSLATGFYTAGVQNILFTLWSVPNKQTTQLIEAFYQYWQEDKMPMTSAIRHAKLNYLSNADELTKHPFFWAGFVLHHKQLKEKTQETSVWWLVGSILLTTCILLITIYKRNQSNASSSS